MKKFYKLVSHRREGQGYHILLDERPVKAPSGNALYPPTEKLADEIVREWAAQEEEIIPDSMPLTQILTTRQDRVSVERAAMQAAVLKYLDTDLICYPAAEPEALAQAQEECWAPWRQWFEERFEGALNTTTGLGAITQSPEIHKDVSILVTELDDDVFTALQLVTSLSGSLVLALAFTEGAMQADDVLKAAFVEEDYQGQIYGADKYGEDPMLEKRRADMQRDLSATRLFLEGLEPA